MSKPVPAHECWFAPYKDIKICYECGKCDDPTCGQCHEITDVGHNQPAPGDIVNTFMPLPPLEGFRLWVDPDGTIRWSDNCAPDEAAKILFEFFNTLNQPITLEQAVAVLNEREHNRAYDWRVVNDPGHPTLVMAYSRYEDAIGLMAVLTDFECIAVAEKYLRESK